MTIDDIRQMALKSEAVGIRVNLAIPDKIPRGFPRGELLNDNRHRGGSRVYSFDALKLLEWCRKAEK